MAIKKMVLADVGKDTVIKRIKDIVKGKQDPVSKTCWNYVALYLKKHEGTKGKILLYTTPGPGPHTVAHVVLIDSSGNTLMDSLKGERSDNNKEYHRDGFDEPYVLMDTVNWPA